MVVRKMTLHLEHHLLQCSARRVHRLSQRRGVAAAYQAVDTAKQLEGWQSGFPVISRLA